MLLFTVKCVMFSIRLTVIFTLHTVPLNIPMMERKVLVHSVYTIFVNIPWMQYVTVYTCENKNSAPLHLQNAAYVSKI